MNENELYNKYCDENGFSEPYRSEYKNRITKTWHYYAYLFEGAFEELKTVLLTFIP
jgi:hypothetical protein